MLFSGFCVIWQFINPCKMASIIILIDTTIPSISIADWDGTNPSAFNSISTSVAFIPSPTSMELGYSTAEMGIGVPGVGRTVDFPFSEIVVFTIDSVDQIGGSSPAATTLQHVVDLCLAHCQ